MCYNKPEAVIVLGEDNMEIITSVNNQRVKDVANLKQKKIPDGNRGFFCGRSSCGDRSGTIC